VRPQDPKSCPFLLVLLVAPGLLADRPTPRLLLTADDFARIQRLSLSAPWAAAARAAILQIVECGWWKAFSTIHDPQSTIHNPLMSLR
jgi:hypothetical protein